MNEIKKCNLKNTGQHCWITLPKGKGLQCYSCPQCGQVIYWSDITLSWVKPATSGGKSIKGNLPTPEHKVIKGE